MTLNELIDVIDPNRDSEKEIIQICAPGKDWEDFDEVLTSSVLLCPIGKAKVKTIGAIAEDVIRVDIDWNFLKEDKTNE